MRQRKTNNEKENVKNENDVQMQEGRPSTSLSISQIKDILSREQNRVVIRKFVFTTISLVVIPITFYFILPFIVSCNPFSFKYVSFFSSLFSLEKAFVKLTRGDYKLVGGIGAVVAALIIQIVYVVIALKEEPTTT